MTPSFQKMCAVFIAVVPIVAVAYVVGPSRGTKPPTAAEQATARARAQTKGAASQQVKQKLRRKKFMGIQQGQTGTVTLTGLSSGSNSGWHIYDPSNTPIASGALGATVNGYKVDNFNGSNAADVTVPGGAAAGTNYRLAVDTSGFYQGYFDVTAAGGTSTSGSNLLLRRRNSGG